MNFVKLRILKASKVLKSSKGSKSLKVLKSSKGSKALKAPNGSKASKTRKAKTRTKNLNKKFENLILGKFESLNLSLKI